MHFENTIDHRKSSKNSSLVKYFEFEIQWSLTDGSAWWWTCVNFHQRKDYHITSRWTKIRHTKNTLGNQYVVFWLVCPSSFLCVASFFVCVVSCQSCSGARIGSGRQEVKLLINLFYISSLHEQSIYLAMYQAEPWPIYGNLWAHFGESKWLRYINSVVFVAM